MCGSTMSANSHSSAGASSRMRIRRRCQTRIGMARGSAMGASVAGEADRTVGIEAEVDALADFQVGKPACLGQRDAKLETSQLFMQQHCRVGTVKQQALDRSGVVRLILRQ